MTQDEIVKGNKLIAEFIKMIEFPATELSGGEILYQWPGDMKRVIGKDFNFPDHERYSLQRLQYHTSWDWIMPVVEKINQLGFTMEILIGLSGSDVHIGNGKQRLNIIAFSKTIDAVWNAVVQFLQWQIQKTI